MATAKQLQKRRTNRAFRVRNRVRGTAERPRITIHRTLKHLYVQLIDDDSGQTVCSTSTKSLSLGYGGNVASAEQVGDEIAKLAKEKGVTKACFDRGPYAYHGRIRAIADKVRAAGIEF